MPTLPDANSIDFGQISAWVGGIATVLGSAGIALWLSIRKAINVNNSAPAPTIVEKTETKIITADTVAMERLADVINSMIQQNQIMSVAQAEDRKVTLEVVKGLEAFATRLGDFQEMLEKEIAARTVREQVRQAMQDEDRERDRHRRD